MTPFGERVRELRNERGMTQKEMAKKLNVSAAYLSALEHGKRGTPRWILVQQIIACLNIIWDDADELQTLALRSAPRVTIDTADLSPRATELANLLASGIDVLSDEALEDLRIRLDAAIRNSEKVPKYLPRE
ncbi:helix-turn-helix domain-containing protein [Ahrensia marina]|uniref:XRE family transcriptional regulator n=1 Tax=Ahrensia marina TaxID=1514904 RepID=A0A0N0E8D6_9HYPH|nr:helix-turn-helix transcriptional regulator [Ahrensia marina]KPB02122.1 XRE family transcriptional regulator [Ahrensia marina]